MKTIILILIILVPFLAFAEQKEIPENVLNELSSDLAELQEEILHAQVIQSPPIPWAAAFGAVKRGLTVTQDSVEVRAGASDNAESLIKAAMGASFTVVDKAGPWYAVTLDKPVKGVHAGWLNAKAVVPYTKYRPISEQARKTVSEKILSRLTSLAIKFRKKYKDNEYLSVSGFSVDVGVPPSVSVDFEFK